MNYSKKRLLERYILSEVYNIAQKENLLENKCHLVLDNILIEGKVWDLTKKTFDAIKNVFNKKDSIKVLRDQAKVYRKKGKKKSAERLEDSANGLESGVFRNQSLALIAIASIMFINNFKNTNNIESSNQVFDKAVSAAESRKPEQFNDLAEKYLFRDSSGIDIETLEQEFDDSYEEEQIASKEKSGNAESLLKIFSHVIKNAEEEEFEEESETEESSQEDDSDTEIYEFLRLDNFDGDINKWSEDFLSSPNKEILEFLSIDLRMPAEEGDLFAQAGVFNIDTGKKAKLKNKVEEIITFLDKNNADSRVAEVIGALATGKIRGYFDDVSGRTSSRLSDIVSQVEGNSKSILADYVMELAPNMNSDDFDIEDNNQDYQGSGEDYQGYDEDEDYVPPLPAWRR
jgi:hypothetical protein